MFMMLLGMKAIASNPVKIGVMLPLHNLDGDGKRMTEYYRGVLMACDELKNMGISTDIHAWNVPNGADIRPTLLSKGADKCNLIIGPLYSSQVTELSNFCKAYKIKMLIPFSITGNPAKNNKYIYQVYQSPEELNEKAVEAYLNRFPNSHPVIVDCNDSTTQKGVFTTALRKLLDKHNIQMNITNLESPDESFIKAFDKTKSNVVILNSGKSRVLTAALNKLDKVKATNPSLVISLYGYTEWLMYAPYNMERFFKYDTYIPTTFYYNTSSVKTRELEREYQKWFGEKMQYALPRFAIIGYDQAMYFIKGIHQFGANFTGAASQSSAYTPLQTPLKFKQQGKGGYKNQNFQLIHYNSSHTIEAITY